MEIQNKFRPFLDVNITRWPQYQGGPDDSTMTTQRDLAGRFHLRSSLPKISFRFKTPMKRT